MIFAEGGSGTLRLGVEFVRSRGKLRDTMRTFPSIALVVFLGVISISAGITADAAEVKTANGFFETNLQGLRNNPVVKTVLQGNSSMIAAAVTTAGIGLLKRAASNPTIACVCQKPLAQSQFACICLMLRTSALAILILRCSPSPFSPLVSLPL